MSTQHDFMIDFENTPFLKTSETAAFTNRLNWRCEILLNRNQEVIRNKKILDLASHDGRFSYACLKLGASHVTGIEGRPHLVRNAIKNLMSSGYSAKNFAFVQDDVLNYLPKISVGKFDVILCFGFFYHTIRQIELLQEIKRIKPKYFILDTLVEMELTVREKKKLFLRLAKGILKIRPRHFILVGKNVKKLKHNPIFLNGNKPCLVFKYESHEHEASTIDPIDLIALPTKSFIELFLKQYGFTYKQLYWNKEKIEKWAYLGDYKAGNRVSYIVKLF